MSDEALTLFIEEARAVTVGEAAANLGFSITRFGTYAGPCPSCGGHDRFAISLRAQAFNCRGCGAKGRDGIALHALANGHSLSSRTGFLAACSEALGGRDIPEGGERESDDERRERTERIAERKRLNAEREAKQAGNENAFRAKEIERARGLYLKTPDGNGYNVLLREYLRLRTGFDMHDAVFANLRLAPNQTYWHGKDERGYEIAFYAGPAMVAPFVDLGGQIMGCHQTWIDIRNGPKFRPHLVDDDGNALPTKKMRGSKKGMLIPLFNRLGCTRWVGGEGIENGLTIAGAEGFRPDTFYFAAGDLGNLAGPADPKSRFRHPHEVREDRRGRLYAPWVDGPVPKPDQAADEAMQVPDHVTELLLLADGDSDKWMTAAAMVRAQTRLARPGRDVWEWRAPDGTDFASLMTG